MATRVASGKTIAILGSRLPEMMGGSADLNPSTHTNREGAGNFEPENWGGHNMHFGIREHAMGAILNGMALHRGLIPYGGTFLVFSDYMRPPMRLAAMNALQVIYVFTHDSIGMGEDGPTHQPVEQLIGLRSIPGMVVLRPADANETVAAWRIAVGRKKGPIALVLTRQGLPVLSLDKYPGIPAGVPLGAYTLADSPAAQNRTSFSSRPARKYIWRSKAVIDWRLKAFRRELSACRARTFSPRSPTIIEKISCPRVCHCWLLRLAPHLGGGRI